MKKKFLRRFHKSEGWRAGMTVLCTASTTAAYAAGGVFHLKAAPFPSDCLFITAKGCGESLSGWYGEFEQVRDQHKLEDFL